MTELSELLIAPARRVFTVAHVAAGDTTRCGLDTTDPAELWQPAPADLADRVCPACTDAPNEELTLL